MIPINRNNILVYKDKFFVHVLADALNKDDIKALVVYRCNQDIMNIIYKWYRDDIKDNSAATKDFKNTQFSYFQDQCANRHDSNRIERNKGYLTNWRLFAAESKEEIINEFNHIMFGS